MFAFRTELLKDFLWCSIFFFFTVSNGAQYQPSEIQGEVRFTSSNKALETAFGWAKEKALSYAHDNSDPVGYWYEAALPNREAFCMRDVSHQAIGAEILGLGAHNHNMLLKFAKNISKERDYCSYWEIDRQNRPAPVDYESDSDFWYNLPANFDIIYNILRVYEWSGNSDYLENEVFTNFYDLSMNAYVDHWDLGSEEVKNRDRSMHLAKDLTRTRFGHHRGIPTYNEGGRGTTLLGVDMTASLIAAYRAYAQILRYSGEEGKAKVFDLKADREKAFMNEFWWDAQEKQYRSIWYEDGSFDYFMVGDNQAFLHYIPYFNAVNDSKKVAAIVKGYHSNVDKLIVELKSYLPIIFYEHHYTEKANQLIIDLCSAKNARRDYPENSFTVIEHITRGLMGIEPHAGNNTFSTLSRLSEDNAWAKIESVPIISNKITVRHEGQLKTVVVNESGPALTWTAKIPGTHPYLYFNGEKVACNHGGTGLDKFSYVTVTLNVGQQSTVTAP